MFRERLRQEYARRRGVNPRYSLRAFAALLSVDHSTLSQILRGKRTIPPADIRRWAKKLGLDSEETRVCLAAEGLPDASVIKRRQDTLNWIAEAAAVSEGTLHWRIVQLLRRPDFQADCRWVSERVDASVDEVNVALTRLLRLGLIRMETGSAWIETTGASKITEQDFRSLLLKRVRERTKTL